MQGRASVKERGTDDLNNRGRRRIRRSFDQAGEANFDIIASRALSLELTRGLVWSDW